MNKISVVEFYRLKYCLEIMYDDEFVEVSVLEEVFVEIRSMVTTLLELVEEEMYLVNVTRRRGRPCIDIPEEQLLFLIENNFRNTDIARMLLVSPKTVRRRIQQYGLERQSCYSHLTLDELDVLTLGFDPSPTLTFNEEAYYPTSSTCAMQLNLPTQYWDDYETFKQRMTLGFQSHGGFGLM